MDLFKTLLGTIFLKVNDGLGQKVFRFAFFLNFHTNRSFFIPGENTRPVFLSSTVHCEGTYR